MPSVPLGAGDAVELAELLGFLGRFKYLANMLPLTFLFVGVGLERCGLIRQGLAAGKEELAQNARRWTTLGVSPFEITTEAGRWTWRQLLAAIEKDLVLTGAHPGMGANDLAGYLFAHSTGHFASLMTLIARGCRRAVRTGTGTGTGTGTEKFTRDLLAQVRNAAAEAALPAAGTCSPPSSMSTPSSPRCSPHEARDVRPALESLAQ